MIQPRTKTLHLPDAEVTFTLDESGEIEPDGWGMTLGKAQFKSDHSARELGRRFEEYAKMHLNELIAEATTEDPMDREHRIKEERRLNA